MLSIITVCYNAEKVIAKTIESVLQQKCLNYEYIFVDGKSQDRTLEVVKEYSKLLESKGVSVKIVSEKDSGIYDAMNKGVAMANGNWINLLNAGDVYCDDEVLRQVENQIRENNADIYVGQVINCEGYLGKKFTIAEIENLENGMIFCHQSMFVRKELFESKRFNLKYRYSADYEWSLHMYKAGYKFCYMDFPIVFYDSSGVSNVNREKTLAEAACIQGEYGCNQNTDTESKPISLKGKLFKFISCNKFLAYMIYKLVLWRKQDVYWLGDNK